MIASNVVIELTFPGKCAHNDQQAFPEVAMTPIHLTNEQVQALEHSGEQPPTAIDPRTNTAYVLVRADVYERARSLLEQALPSAPSEPRVAIAPAMLRSQQAFWRDLPELLKLKSKTRQWVAYHGDERVGFGKTKTEVYQECLRRGLQRGDFYVGKIEEEETPPWGMLEGDRSLYEFADSSEEAGPPDAV
jgi:hypothetical protein